ARQRRDGLDQAGVDVDGGEVDVVDLGQEFLGVGVVELDEAGQRGAVVPVISLLDAAGLLGIDVQEAHYEGLHPPVDLGKKVGIGPVQGVVQVEDPGPDVAEVGGGRHGAGRWAKAGKPARPGR